MYRHKGFTLIELITVIAILGALAVIALPRFINLQDEAEQAATDGVAGSLGAATAVNLAGALAGETSANLDTVTNCRRRSRTACRRRAAQCVVYRSSRRPSALRPTGATASCTLNGPSSATATFTGYAVPAP
ncbi:MAG: prepilin-type N-terminal cleavage/methylation domain-containing protein [Halofilum sp. (in: g-proteobacteria)]|nr:prepilin-type N-terminal cleavage/methylation domain-containing protein [Halofilum sp. (in: g-proteobacteria)]